MRAGQAARATVAARAMQPNLVTQGGGIQAARAMLPAQVMRTGPVAILRPGPLVTALAVMWVGLAAMPRAIVGGMSEAIAAAPWAATGEESPAPIAAATWAEIAAPWAAIGEESPAPIVAAYQATAVGP